jgi:ectoine hydroxylase-related dioxygenase (phytanoyl-CoA dioxygenase family)
MSHYSVDNKSKKSSGWLDKFMGLFVSQQPAKPAGEYDFDNPEPFSPPRFDSNDPYITTYFKEHGYVVIRNVANKEQQETGVSLFWDLCESKQPALKRNDPSTWITDHWVASPSVGIMSGYGIGQSEFLWYARLLPKVREAFATIWGNDDLLVSYDGCGVFRPPEINPKWRTDGAWYHIDQNLYNRPGLHAIQGLLNFFPSGTYDGGFVVTPKSHLMIEEAFARIPDLCSKKARDYFRTPADLIFWTEARNAIKRNETNRYDLLPVKLVLDAGDLVLWDSRTIHCSHPATRDDPSSANRLKRLAAYICMTPAASAKNLEELAKYRVLAFQKGITTTHWPHEFYPSWIQRDKLPGVGAEVVKLTPEQSTLITGKSFAAWNVYDEKLIDGVDLDNLKY